MFDYETAKLLAKKELEKEGFPLTGENLNQKMREIQDKSNIGAKGPHIFSIGVD